MPGEILAVASPAARAARDAVWRRSTASRGAILMGDSVHVVVDDAARRVGRAQERRSADARVPVDEIERIAPSIEDLFVSLLTEKGT